MSAGKILVVLGGAIGDFVLTLPVLSALRQQLPGALIELLAYPNVAVLALRSGLANAVRSIDARPLAGFFARNGTLDPALEEYFAGFAVIISYLYDPDLIFQENIKRCSKAQFIAGPHRPSEREDVHATEVFLRPLERLAIFEADPQPRLTMKSEGAGTELEAWVQKRQTLAVHPGSGSEQKNWPEGKWRELLERLLQETPLQILLIGGEAEGGKLERLASVLPAGRGAVASSLLLTQLATLLQHSNHFLGHDSGISHLAAATGTRALLLWGPTNEKIWRPRGEQIKLLKPVSLQDLSVQEVLQAVKAMAKDS